jgi:AcrR family transcriptional regulator
MNDTKDFIIKTAFKLFLLNSFRDVTMQEIVKATKLSKGAFYHYFKSKEELFLEVVENFFLFDVFLNKNENLKNISLKEYCLEYLTHTHEFIEEIKNVVGLDTDNIEHNISYFTMVFDAMRRFPDFKEKVLASQIKDLEIWQIIIENATKNQEISPKMSSEMSAKIFLQTVDATFLYSLNEKRFAEALEEIKKIWEGFYIELGGKW